MNSRITILLALLRDAALAGQPAPSNIRIGEALGCQSGRASEWLRLAEVGGHIIVHRGSNARVVAAADGSWRTAGPIPTVPRRGGGRPRKPRPLPQPERLHYPPGPGEEGASIHRIGPPGWSTPVTLASPAVPAAVPRQRPMPGIRHSTCQWPLGEPGEPDFRFCAVGLGDGAPPYCAEHRALAFVGLRTADAEAPADDERDAA